MSPPEPTPEASPRQRLRLCIRGAVQGVGFRPFIYRLATEMGLPGWVNNSAQGVFVEVEGTPPQLQTFLLRIEREKPPHAVLYSVEPAYLDLVGYTGFVIRSSSDAGAKSALVLPDLATCAECLRDIRDASNRRYRYPFTNCTHCGPRYSIIEGLPYDRPRTTMRGFVMCPACRAEYEDPRDRRFHAQPNACPECGPHLELWDHTGQVLATRDAALLRAADALRQGMTLAVKGLGGFHLIADARREEPVQALRVFKAREEKPFALMFPSLEAARTACDISDMEERLLRSPESPIVLLRRRPGAAIATAVAPGNPYLGVMLPYTPLHHLLLAELGFPVVATSGNLAEEPICTDEREAVERLGRPGCLLLVHNRPIARHVDDSIVRVVLNRELVLRRARGYAPLPIHLTEPLPATLAVGAHLKNTIAAAVGSDVFVSQHIGDLDTLPAFDAFRRTIDSFERLYEFRPTVVACDLHPDYRSTQYAQSSGLPVVGVQHHYAHVLACMAENELEGTVLGVCWDGTGYGTDGTIWGGEFLRATRIGFERFAHFRPFPLPGGDQAVREPRRSALGILYALFGDDLFERDDFGPERWFTKEELAVLRGMLRRRVNTPLTSSAGRLFDAAAALLGLRTVTRFEGQAAQELEFAADGGDEAAGYDVALQPSETAGTPFIFDWGPLITAMRQGLAGGVPRTVSASKFHNALAEGILAVARRAGEARVVLTGGCFQNRVLTERAVRRLRAAGFRPYWHQRIPPNDGGIAVGQALAVLRVNKT